MKLSSLKNKKLQEGTFRARKVKNPSLTKSFIFQEMELSSPILKKRSCVSGGNLQSPKNNNYLYFC